MVAGKILDDQGVPRRLCTSELHALDATPTEGFDGALLRFDGRNRRRTVPLELLKHLDEASIGVSVRAILRCTLMQSQSQPTNGCSCLACLRSFTHFQWHWGFLHFVFFGPPVS